MMLQNICNTKISIGEVVTRLGDKTLPLREERDITSEFSQGLNLTFDWFDSNFTKIVSEAIAEFWGISADVKLMSISENTNFLAEGEEFFVTQIRLNKELSVFIRLSKQLVRSLLEKILGPNGKTFNIEKISELEAKILTGFDNYLYKNFIDLVKSGSDLPSNNNNYNECNLTFYVKAENYTLGKIVVKLPVVAITPVPVELEEETFSIADFLSTTALVNLSVGHTRIRLNDLKHLEKDDIVVLENSNASMMTLKYENYSRQIRVVPNPAIMTEYDDFEDNASTPKGDKNMPGSDIYNMWDSIQVDINAEFEKVKLTLGELKQISEGLVVDIGSVYDNKIDLKVEDKIVASGELIIINDRYGVKINQIFTEEKESASANAQQAENQHLEEEIQQQFEEPEEGPEQEEFLQEEQPQGQEEINEEDFDYSDFDVDDEDI